MKNIGEAILIIGMTYFGFTYGFAWWINSCIVFALGTWSYYGLKDEQKALIKSQIRFYEAKAEYYRSRGDYK